MAGLSYLSLVSYFIANCTEENFYFPVLSLIGVQHLPDYKI